MAAGSNEKLFVDVITPAKWCVCVVQNGAFVLIFAVIQGLVKTQTIFCACNLRIELISSYGRCAECTKWRVSWAIVLHAFD